MKDCLLAVDIGTSACKTAVFDLKGQLLAAKTVSYSVYHPAKDWAEQNPEQWWQAACEGIQACMCTADIHPHRIAGIGVDGQSWSCIPIDREGNILANTPIWFDTRARDICQEAKNEGLTDAIFQLSGNPYQPSYTTPKIIWFRRHMPAVYEKANYFLQSNSFIVYRLTDTVSQDVSQGYGLHVFDIRKKCYNSTLCKQLGIDMEKLPPIYQSWQVVGNVTQKAAEATGLVPGIPVVAGGLDAACGTLGAGVFRPGQTQEQGGQAGGMSICLDCPTASPELILGTHVIPDRWLLQGGTVGGGGSLRWLARELGNIEQEIEKETGENQFALLDRLAETVSPGSNGMVFLPYLSGERSPIWDPDACGVYFGIHYSSTRAHFFRALMEGAAFALKHNIEVAKSAGVKVTEMHAMGGAANSIFWTQMKSDVTGVPIFVPESDVATCKGAAILAGIGAGIFQDCEEALKEWVNLKRCHQPQQQNQSVYNENYAVYRQLYKDLKPTMAFSAKQRRSY